ncbi:unnamed protein product [Sphagnum compactum]
MEGGRLKHPVQSSLSKSALKLGIAKSVESKSQVSLSMTSCLWVLKQLVKWHTKIHLWSLLTLRILFKGWRV